MLDHAHLSRKLSPNRPRPVLGAVVALALLAAACTKTEGQSSGTTGTAATGTPSSSASAASAAPDASPVAADTTTGSSPTGGADATAPTPSASAASAATAATASASGGVAPATSATGASADGAGTCGKKPLPDCPLQGWMKSNTNPAIASQDFPGLATALDKVATFAPAGYTNWASIAKDGAKAARASDMTATKASCRTCHDQYKDKYKKELRTRKI